MADDTNHEGDEAPKKRGPGRPPKPKPPAKPTGFITRDEVPELSSFATRDDRIEWIVDLMLNNRFQTGRTYRLLAEVWGLSRHTVRKDCAEASQLALQECATSDGVRERLMVGLFSSFDGALASDDPRERRHIHKYADVISKIAGITGPVRVEHSGPGGGPISVSARDELLKRIASVTASEAESSEEEEPSSESD